MPAYKLMLLPADPGSPPVNCVRLAGELQAIGLIGAPVALEDNLFYPTGDNFLQLISFLGCSPYIQLAPPANGGVDFCHITLFGPLGSPQLLHGKNTRPPRCPSCKAPIANWREGLETESLSCARCNLTSPLSTMEWRNNAGLGRFFIVIQNIFPGEAVPVDALMNQLRGISGGEWGYFYIQT